jgi:hypothetical protein
MKSNELSVLFITEKWFDGIPSGGLTNNYHNLFGTFKLNYPNIKFNVFHLDECATVLKTHIDNVIPSILEKTNPNLVIFSLLGKSGMNPTKFTYDLLKQKNIKMVFIWPDIGYDWGLPEINNSLKNYADLHICWGSEQANIVNDKLLWLWAPQNESLYYPCEESEKDINVSFIGATLYEERVRYLNYLLKNNVPITIKGGQRQDKLESKDYASYIRRSKISINFPFCPSGFDQCKGRVWEILASKSLLLERKNIPTSKMLIPNVHYVEYYNEEDLKNKIYYYLNNDEERIKIQNSGYQIYKQKYSSKHYWNEIFEKLQIQIIEDKHE